VCMVFCSEKQRGKGGDIVGIATLSGAVGSVDWESFSDRQSAQLSQSTLPFPFPAPIIGKNSLLMCRYPCLVPS
jgi:hypothetical protein